MKRSQYWNGLKIATIAVAACAVPRAVLACAACYGAPDAAQTRGMNFGIFTMLGVTGVVLASLGGMIFCFARRASRYGSDLTP
jgi:hypothetical protein